MTTVREIIERDTIITVFHPPGAGGQVVDWFGFQSMKAHLPDHDITITIRTRKSQRKTRQLLWDLIEYAVGEQF